MTDENTTQPTVEQIANSMTAEQFEAHVDKIANGDEALAATEAIVDSTPTVDEEPEKPAEMPAETGPVTEELVEVASPDARKKQSVYQEFDVNSQVPLDHGDRITLPGNFDKETRSILEGLPNVTLLDNPSSRRWASAVHDGLAMETQDEMFVPSLEDPEADFRQQLVHKNISLAAQAPKFKAIENENIKGERAVIRMITHLGLGTLFQVPLWHSGFWITFKPATDSEILELNRLMISDKIQLGRRSYGLAFSNTTSYTVDRLMDFALSHVYDTTVKPEDIAIENLRHHISTQDIPSVLWGFLCTMYPRGFRYQRACVTDPTKCNHVSEETLNLTKLQWTNGSALTDWQKTHMSSRQPKSKDLASVNRYKEELSKIQKTRVIINEGRSDAIALTLKTPSVAQHIESGHRWIGDIVTSVERALSTEPKDDERNQVITQHGQASSMRQYTHWVDSIELDTNTVDDQETIEKLLSQFSADDVVRESFIEHVVDYINKSMVSVIGIPVFDCPKCGSAQEGSLKLPAYKNIIPLDVIQVFFDLHTQRLERIAER